MYDCFTHSSMSSDVLFHVIIARFRFDDETCALMPIADQTHEY